MKPVSSQLVYAFTMLLLALTGCNPPAPEPKVGHVRMETVSHAVAFNEGGAIRLSRAEQDALAAFIAAIPPAAVSAVDLAADGMSPRAVARARSVRDYLAQRGFDRKLVRFYPTSGIDARTVVLTVQYAKAIPPQHCPDWSKGATGSYETTDTSDFGCSYNADFLIQIANPADFNGGHATPLSDAQRESIALQRYLAGSPPSSSSGGSSGSSGASGVSSSAAPSP